MRSESRTLLFCLTLLVGAPLLYAIGEALSGGALALTLAAGASCATGIYAWRGDRPQPPGAQPPQPQAAPR